MSSDPSTSGTSHETAIGAEESRVLLRAATAAPSLHNSQPWAFAVGARHVELYADASRQLRNADPSGRSLLVSCGAALFNLRVAAEHLGFRPRCRLLPDAEAPSLVAVMETGHRRASPGELSVFFLAVAARRTNRRPFRDEHPPRSVLNAATEAAHAEGAHLAVVEDPAEIARLVDLLNEADASDHNDAGRTAERQAWIGGPHRDAGVPVASLGPRPTTARSAFRDLGQAVSASRDSAEFETAPTLAILSTAHDQPVDWVRAGQALERVLLTATMSQVAVSFLNQPLEHDDLRRMVRSQPPLVGHPHMILRLGYGDDVPPTPRRPLDDVQRPPRLTV
jgi:nitroreductase